MPSPLPTIQRRSNRREIRERSTSQRVQLVVLGFGFLISVLMAAGIFALAMAWSRLTAGLPNVAELPILLNPSNGALLQPTRLYDRSGEHLLAELAPTGVPRRYVALDPAKSEHLPQDLADATLAAADPTFWSQPGCLLGGSPGLAQVLARDLLLWDEPASPSRDLRTCLLALQMTHSYGRSKVLEWYLNSADYGRLAHGADSAAQLYFGKPAAELDLAESALLAAVSQSPALNPFDAPEAAIQAQRALLSKMATLGLISPTEAEQAVAETLNFQLAPAAENVAPAFVTLALDELSGLIPRQRLERGGLNITTSLDYELQVTAECLLNTQVARAAGGDASCPDAPATNGLLPPLAPGQPNIDLSASLAVTDTQSGQVLAVVGDTGSDGTQAGALKDHPAGSLTIPFIYLTDFARGGAPASLVWDIPGGLSGLPADVQTPGGDFHGPVRLREAMAGGYWVPAAEALQNLGADSVARTAAPFGLDLQPDRGDPLALLTGQQLVSPLDVAQAYGIFGTGGILAGQPRDEALRNSTVLKVETTDHAPLLDRSTPQKLAVVSEPLAFLVNNVLGDATARSHGLASAGAALQLDRPAAATLGQTLDGHDSWAVGYTPQRAISVWTGSDSAIPSAAVTGLWHAVAEAASRDLPVQGWEQPAGITATEVCDPSGLLPSPACPSVVREYFLTGTEPTVADNLYATYPVNRETGFLATIFTPLNLIDNHTYMLIPDAARRWAASVGLVAPPQAYDTIQYTSPDPNVSIASPAMFTDLTGSVTVTGTAAGKDFLFYRLQYGQGLNPQEWFQIGDNVTSAVTSGKLGGWDTAGLSGLYVLQLQVVYLDQTLKTDSVVVDLANPSPTP